MRAIEVFGGTLCLLLASCGAREQVADDSNEESSRSPPAAEQSGADAPDEPTTEGIEDYQLLATQLEKKAIDYRDDSAGVDSVVACERLRDEYTRQIRSQLSEMVDMSDAMDAYVAEHGGGDVTDLHCVSVNMMSELDHHLEQACVNWDADTYEEEITRHVETMLSYVDHTWERCDEMMAGIDSDDWQFAPMMSVCADFDESCSENVMHGHMMRSSMMVNVCTETE